MSSPSRTDEVQTDTFLLAVWCIVFFGDDEPACCTSRRVVFWLAAGACFRLGSFCFKQFKHLSSTPAQ